MIHSKDDMVEMQFEVVKGLLQLNNICFETQSLSEFENSIQETDFTGLGINTTFLNDSSTKLHLISNDMVLDGICVTINGTVEVSFILKIENKKMKWLEGFCYGAEEFPKAVSSFNTKEEKITRI